MASADAHCVTWIGKIGTRKVEYGRQAPSAQVRGMWTPNRTPHDPREPAHARCARTSTPLPTGLGRHAISTHAPRTAQKHKSPTVGALRSSARRPETHDRRSAAMQQRASRRNIYRARIPERMPTVATPLASLGARARQSYCARFPSKQLVFLCSRFQPFDLE